ncbi:hypothetical protein H2200_011396 [Cladophialophora chaetospira]|uniref:Uncharacterized protein n=1 Tax=Cladophialophora chaetospira TaxID=386627 RepID=A0AA39CD40_9EURO|nr:hypothetical protein H2200_011396 [Cladophialophora chaetospira]
MPSDASSSESTQQAAPSNLPLQPAQPPCDNAWYEKFFKDHKALAIHYDRGGSRKLARGLGLSDQQRDIIVAKARGFLPPGRCFDMKSVEGLYLKNTVAQQRLASPDVGPLLRPSFPASYELATRFFNEAPGRWVLVANVENREVVRLQARIWPSNPDNLSNAQDTRRAIANEAQYGRRRGTHKAADFEEDTDFPEPIAVTQRLTARPRSTGANGTTLLHQSAPQDVVVISDDDDDKEDEGEIKKEEKGDTAGRTHHNSSCSPPLYPPIDWNCNTPLPSQVFLGPIIKYWNDHLLLLGYPVVDPANIRCRFVSPGLELGVQELGINNDVNLRVAYRLWLSRGNVNEPFVVFVDDI